MILMWAGPLGVNIFIYALADNNARCVLRSDLSQEILTSVSSIRGWSNRICRWGIWPQEGTPVLLRTLRGPEAHQHVF